MASNSTDIVTGAAPAHGLRHTLSKASSRFQCMRPGDAGIAARAQLRILDRLGTSSDSIRTSAVGGYVELRGSVPSREARESAAEAARGAFGANGVLNFLEVK